MDYERWAPRYDAIRSEFGFPFELEEASAGRLLELLPSAAHDAPLARIGARIGGRAAVVVGLAPGAGAPPLWRWPGPRPVLVASDGAAAICLSAGLVPDVIVTDLDGSVPSEVSANGLGALVVVHAHGDNVPALERWVAEFPGELAGSWAGPPRDALLNVGGFTDGDRAAYLAQHVGASRVVLWGFDLTGRALSEAGPRKAAKLAWADRLLAELADASPVPIERWRPDGRCEPYRPGPIGPSTQ